MASSGRKFRELYDYAYTVSPNIDLWPLQAPGRNRNSADIFQGYVTAALGAVAVETKYGITRVRSTDVFDVVGGNTLRILIPGFYKIRFEITVTGAYDIEIEEAGLGLGQLRAAAGTAGTATDENTISLTAFLNDSTITPAAPAIIEFNANVQTENLFGAINSLIYVERVGEVVSLV